MKSVLLIQYSQSGQLTDVARSIIQPLQGPVRPRGFQGGLPFAYHVGGTDAVKVHLKTDMDYKLRPIWNVVSRIDGSSEKDRLVILGNHRDAWVFGAVDPNSGTSTMLEVAKGFGDLLKQGWQPKRTIILCSWDAEEYGLIGSTEWAEENAAEERGWRLRSGGWGLGSLGRFVGRCHWIEAESRPLMIARNSFVVADGKATPQLSRPAV